MSIPVWLEVASAAGQALGGVATAAAVAVAGYELLWRRRSDRRDERRGDAAVGVLVTFASHSRSLIGKCLLLQETIGHGHVEDADALSVATKGAESFAKIENWLFVDLPDEMYEARLKTSARRCFLSPRSASCLCSRACSTSSPTQSSSELRVTRRSCVKPA